MRAPNSPGAACILIATNDPALRNGAVESLGRDGFRTIVAANAAEVDRALSREAVDLIVLDAKIPGEGAISVCRRLPDNDSPPIIMVSPTYNEIDRVVALEVGADHYLTEPWTPRELVAYVRAQLRRSAQSRGNAKIASVYRFLGWRMDLSAHELTDPNGAVVKLRATEFAILRAFVERPRAVLTRQQLLDAIQGRDSKERSIDVCISRLRQKMNCDDLIRTVPSHGYIFVPAVERG